jgi:tetratricopeptide (TPR) repeat protein
MPACWTCGSPVDSLTYTCPSCKSLKGLADLKHQVQFQGLATNLALAQLARVQAKGFAALQATMSKGFAQLANIIEWGFGELSWQIQEQTDVLREIDHTLKTPTQTQANEYRVMADELARRGELADAESLYRKALGLNPLDFRSYIGLAETLLQTSRFIEAKEVLEKSLAHAPKGNEEQTFITDWKSYSLRLIGHIHACAGEYPPARSALQRATELSPEYPDAQFDYAQYSAQVGDAASCVKALEKAVVRKPLYWNLALRQKAFKPAEKPVKDLLLKVRDAGRVEVGEEIQEVKGLQARIKSELREWVLRLEAATSRGKSIWFRKAPDSSELQKTTHDLKTEITALGARLDELQRLAETAKDYPTLLQVAEECNSVNNSLRELVVGPRVGGGILVFADKVKLAERSSRLIGAGIFCFCTAMLLFVWIHAFAPPDPLLPFGGVAGLVAFVLLAASVMLFVTQTKKL